MKLVFPVAIALVANLAAAAELTVSVNVVRASGVAESIGSIRLVDTSYGLAVYPRLNGLAPGLHGFHIHEKPSCDAADQGGTMVAGLGAGGHYDPTNSRKHGEPWGDGHPGDLPALYVAPDGSASSPVLAPRLKTSDVRNRSIMVHAGGDNHADHPAPLGGGGARVACGVIGS
jgi:Cu-Zn family superoxide dismutase